MSVTILPYIDEVNTENLKTSTKQTPSEDVMGSFREVLAAANRTQQAMAVDALLAAQSQGSISPATIQKLLGFNPQPNIPVADSNAANSASESATQTATSANAGASATASATSGTSGSASLDAYFQEAADTYCVDINLLKAIARAESGFNPDATSSAGAMGVMQLMPSTAKSLGITNPYDAHDNIMGGAKIISQHLTRYNGDLSLALAAYNAGSGNVDKYGGIPPFKETQNYVNKVIAYYKGA